MNFIRSHPNCMGNKTIRRLLHNLITTNMPMTTYKNMICVPHLSGLGWSMSRVPLRISRPIMPCMNCTSAALASTLDRSTASLTSIFCVDSPGRPGCRSGGWDSAVLWIDSTGLGSDLIAIDWHEMAEIHTAKTMIRNCNIVDVKVYTVSALNISSCTRHRWRAP